MLVASFSGGKKPKQTGKTLVSWFFLFGYCWIKMIHFSTRQTKLKRLCRVIYEDFKRAWTFSVCFLPSRNDHLQLTRNFNQLKLQFWIEMNDCRNTFVESKRASHSVVSDPLWAHGLLSMEFSRQWYWSGLPNPSRGDLLNPGIKPPASPALHVDPSPS